ncbi:MAG: hypothetical protein GY767_14020 [Shimia sp.]|nr:hypothetical protein [Shimia sp.]
MPFTIVKRQDWIVTGLDNQPADGQRVTVRDDDTGEVFNVDVPSKRRADIELAVSQAIEERRGLLGMTFE